DGPYAPPVCPQAASPAATGGEPQLAVRLRDPHGKLLTGQTPGVSFSDVSGLGVEFYVVDMNSYPGPGAGAFSVEIEGLQAGYVMRASASSGVTANLLSGHTMAAGQAGRVVVGLLLPAVQQADPSTHPVPRPTEELFGAYNFYTGERVPLDLRDDGLSGDGAAGDGIYGGVWEPQPGLWQLQVQGELADGSAFQRVEAAPIRVNRFGLRAPDPRRVMPGDNVTYQFALSNSGDEAQTFELAISSSLGWAVTDTVPSRVTVAAGETVQVDVQVVPPPEATEGSVEETMLTAVVPGDDALTSAMATARTTAVGQLQLYLPLTVGME
ncbi:MAG: choice-of-anchor X domain-containing protein, partial [Chloroflexota bacterium]